MSYSSNLVFYIPFDSQPVLELDSSTFLTSYGQLPVLVNGVFGSAWQMSDKTYLMASVNCAVTTAMSIGFWLNPANPGMVTNPTTKVTSSLLMPLMSKASFSTISGSVSMIAGSFIVWEETQGDGTNVMKIYLKGYYGATPVTCTLSSSPYQTGSFTHFWIVFNGSVPSLQLFVNTLQDFGATISGQVPNSLNISSAPFSLNNSVIGSVSQIGRNRGTIDDLVILNIAQTNQETIKLAANNGVPYIVVNEIIGTAEIDQAIVFDDPGTSQITSLCSNRGRLYVANSNGSIMRGEKLLWEKRIDFSNQDELNYATVAVKANDASITDSNQTDGVLVISDAVVRFQ